MRIVLGSSRRLTDRYFGFNTPLMWDIPFEDPRTWSLFEHLHAGLFRFPGGLIANYWDWQTGRVDLPGNFLGSFRAAAEEAKRLHPQGSTYEDFVEISRGFGTEVSLVLNIESSSVADQVEWIQHLDSIGIHPTRIELGNELYFGTLFGWSDRFPTVESFYEIAKQYVDAIRPIVPEEARFAILSAGSRFEKLRPGTNPFDDRLIAWDDGLEVADWFDAIVVHTYPEIAKILSPSHETATLKGLTRRPASGIVTTVAMLASEEDARDAMTSILARVEQGSRRQAEFLAERLPDKEVWVTEWGAGENAAHYRGDNPLISGMWINVIARQLQAFLAQPNISMALNHSLLFDGSVWSAMTREDTEVGYRAVGAYDVFRWFGEALDVRRGEIVVHDASVDGATHIAKSEPAGESFTDITATVIDTSSGSRSALVHSAAEEEVFLEFDNLAESLPDVVEAIHTPDLRQTFSRSTPGVVVHEPGMRMTLPPNSIARILWNT